MLRKVERRSTHSSTESKVDWISSQVSREELRRTSRSVSKKVSEVAFCFLPEVRRPGALKRGGLREVGAAGPQAQLRASKNRNLLFVGVCRDSLDGVHTAQALTGRWDHNCSLIRCGCTAQRSSPLLSYRQPGEGQPPELARTRPFACFDINWILKQNHLPKTWDFLLDGGAGKAWVSSTCCHAAISQQKGHVLAGQKERAGDFLIESQGLKG